jgi:hypothetical protein
VSGDSKIQINISAAQRHGNISKEVLLCPFV